MFCCYYGQKVIGKHSKLLKCVNLALSNQFWKYIKINFIYEFMKDFNELTLISRRTKKY